MKSVALVVGLGMMAISPAGSRELPPMLEDGRRGYSEVIQVENVPAAELYARAKAWVAIAYRSAQHVIQLDDAATGKLVIKGNFASSFDAAAGPVYIGHTLVVESKDGRYRYTLSDFTLKWRSDEQPLAEVSDVELTPRGYAVVTRDTPDLIDSLRAAMLKPTPKTDTEW